MLPEFFVLSLGLLLAVLLVWGFKALPKERWQIIGCLLGGKEPGGAWKGLNLTYYGFFNATAYLLAALVFFLLMGSLGVPPAGAAPLPDLAVGMIGLWDPAVLLFFEILWVAAFIHTGRSRVTGSTIRLHVVKENI